MKNNFNSDNNERFLLNVNKDKTKFFHQIWFHSFPSNFCLPNQSFNFISFQIIQTSEVKLFIKIALEDKKKKKTKYLREFCESKIFVSFYSTVLHNEEYLNEEYLQNFLLQPFPPPLSTLFHSFLLLNFFFFFLVNSF